VQKIKNDECFNALCQNKETLSKVIAGADVNAFEVFLFVLTFTPSPAPLIVLAYALLGLSSSLFSIKQTAIL
jgi:hypothetical protein